jgi:hypothetical protein
MDIGSAKKAHDVAFLVILGACPVVGVLLSARGFGLSVLLAVAIVFSPVPIVAGAEMFGYRRSKGRSVWPAIVCPVLSFAILVSVVITHWPLRVSFALSRETMDALAARVRAGERVATPMRVGLITIRETELSRRGVVCLWTNLSPSGHHGFVQCRREAMPSHPWSMIPLDNSWQFIEED